MLRFLAPLFALSLLTGCPPAQPAADGGDGGDAAYNPDVPDPSTLAPPPEGQGIQLRVSFTVPVGTEQQRCWSFRLPGTADLEVVRYEVAYNVGSHHMNLFRMLPTVEHAGAAPQFPIADTTGEGTPCFNAVNFDAYDLVVGSQNERLDWSLPAGVAYRLHAGSAMLLQSHFVNGSTQSTPGDRAEVRVNLWTAPASAAITQHLGTMFANNRQLNIPPHSQNVSYSRGCTVDHPVTVVAATGHFHSRGRQFMISDSADGTAAGSNMFYRSTAWSEPPFSVLDGLASRPAPLQLAANAGLYYTCVFDNPTDFPITFGPHVEYEEHCNLFAYYYPVDPDARARYCF